jgi:hypothetical protein
MSLRVATALPRVTRPISPMRLPHFLWKTESAQGRNVPMLGQDRRISPHRDSRRNPHRPARKPASTVDSHCPWKRLHTIPDRLSSGHCCQHPPRHLRQCKTRLHLVLCVAQNLHKEALLKLHRCRRALGSPRRIPCCWVREYSLECALFNRNMQIRSRE